MMPRTLAAIPLLLLSLPALAVDVAVDTSSYLDSSLFTSPLIAAEKETVTIGVRVKVEGDVGATVPGMLSIAMRAGTRDVPLSLAVKDGVAEATHQVTLWENGLYRLQLCVDPENAITETDETNNRAELVLPVVIPGRKPWFPWFGQKDYLRWANIWAGGFNKEMIARWEERGVMPLAWKWGCNFPNELDEDGFRKMYGEFGETRGIAVDECGYYPFTLSKGAPEPPVARFIDCLKGMARAKEEHPDKFFFMWHCGSLYPEQAALYRNACDLICVESYVSYFAPHGLGTDNVYDFLDMKMRPGRQLDLLGATGKGPQIITSIDLHPGTFNRGQVEAMVRHLRRQWPEMRGFGIFGGLTGKDDADPNRPLAVADEQFVDRLCFEYFVKPVVTILPGNVWVSRGDGGVARVEAAVSNIGGMDSGPVEVELLADGKSIGEVTLASVPAGDSLLTNRAIASRVWSRTPGEHILTARITKASGATVLDASQETKWFAH